MIGKTLYGKLLLLFLGFGVLMTVAFVYVMDVSHETYHAEFEQTAHRDLARQYVAAHLLIREPPLTEHNFANALHHITEINPEIDVYVLDAAGNVLAGSTAAPSMVRHQVGLKPVTQFLGGHAKFPLLGDDPADARHREVFSAAPLSIPECSAAYLYIVLHREEHATGAAGLKTLYAIREGVGVALVAIVLAVAGSVLFLRLLTRRLGLLQQDIERFRDSRFEEFPAASDSAGSSRSDEIGRLRQLFEQLAEQIRGQMQELHKTDEMRRELISNVSHDLRTPLTTLSAHLETLLLKEDLPPEERRGYVGVALGQCRSLRTIVEQLVELAKLDAGQATFMPEPFQLAELAHDVAHKFELSAGRTGVALRVEHADALPLVVGDIRLIEQVLNNLLDNALRHVASGGQVVVRLQLHAAAVRVEVQDTGPGIPANERHRVFERFYRGDKSRSTDSGYLGLGLAIARGILELHGHSIDFVSPPNQGATFFFELSIVRGGGAANDPSQVMQSRREAAR